MKVSERVPPVHLARLRRQAEQAGCEGLLACINITARLFLERKKSTSYKAPPDLSIEDKENPAFRKAWREMEKAIQSRHGQRERHIERKYRDLDEDDCTCIHRQLVYMAEIVPILPPDVRAQLDPYFSELAQQP